jgi:hypothetical protein
MPPPDYIVHALVPVAYCANANHNEGIFRYTVAFAEISWYARVESLEIDAVWNHEALARSLLCRLNSVCS